MTNQKQNRHRVIDGERSHLSKWHFGSQHTDLKKKYNKTKEINKIGQRFSETKDPKDAEQLLVAFNNYLLKYTNLLATGKITSEGKDNNKFYISKDTKRFLSLFCKNGIRSSKDELSQAAARLPNAFISMDADDIYNELVILFLDLLNKFNGTGGFTGFIHHRFAWAVKARVFKWQNDPINYQPMYDDIIEDNNEEANDIYNFIITPTGEKAQVGYDLSEQTGELMPRVYDLPNLDHSFITQPNPPFDIIWTKEQRAIIILKFVNELSNSAISDQLGMGGAQKVRDLYEQALVAYHDFAFTPPGEVE